MFTPYSANFSPMASTANGTPAAQPFQGVGQRWQGIQPQLQAFQQRLRDAGLPRAGGFAQNAAPVAAPTVGYQQGFDNSGFQQGFAPMAPGAMPIGFAGGGLDAIMPPGMPPSGFAGMASQAMLQKPGTTQDLMAYQAQLSPQTMLAQGAPYADDSYMGNNMKRGSLFF